MKFPIPKLNLKIVSKKEYDKFIEKLSPWKGYKRGDTYYSHKGKDEYGPEGLVDFLKNTKMKKFRIYHDDGKPEVIEASSVTFFRDKKGLQIKIGNRKIKDAICLVEVSPEIVFEHPQKIDGDED